jgi:endo-1,4-beta-D-glucanase Y
MMPRRPFPQRLAYAPGSLRPGRRSQDQQDDDVRTAYERWKADFLVQEGDAADGSPLYRVAFGKPGTPNHDVTVSEGQGFGMLLVAHVAGHDPDARSIFDGLWGFVRAHPSTLDERLMNWHVPPDPAGSASAFDGDADVAYALLLADAQWGSDGPVDYRAAVGRVLDGILESTIGPRSRLPLLGDWVDPDGAHFNQHTPRTSDFLLGHFRAYGRTSGDPVWDEVAAACQRVVSVLQAEHSPETGLLPDFVQPVSASDTMPRPADPGFLEGDHDGAYGYNAGRVPWRLGADALLSGDTTSLAQVGKISAWAETATGGDPLQIRAGYALDGTPLDGSDYFTSFFAAPLGVAAMTVATQQRWLDDLYDAVRDRTEDYYEDSVTLLCLLVMTGNWWDPSVA